MAHLSSVKAYAFRLTSHANFYIYHFFLPPIEGVDVVSGIEWLCILGPIKADFSIPSITFNHQNQHITLQATTISTPTQRLITCFANMYIPTPPIINLPPHAF